MKNTIFPKEIIERSSESNFARHSTRSKLIYTAAVLFVAAALLGMPFVYVDVGVRSQGVIRPVSELNQIRSIVSGRIETLTVRNNDYVQFGQLIARIDAPQITEKLTFNRQRQRQVGRFISDLTLLSAMDSTDVLQQPALQNPGFQSAWIEFNQRARHHLQQVLQAERALDRNRKLFEREFISSSVYEEHLHALQSARSDYQLAVEQQKNRWHTDLLSYQDELDRLAAEEKELKKEQELYRIHAPVNGTIQNLASISAGNFIYPNQVLAEISPDTLLTVETYVLPNDIGLIREGMRVRFQVTAFDYNQWGVLEGRVTDISDDVTMLDSQPVFRVLCRPGQPYLSLANGYRGYLKKGMMVQARFIVARRTLFQLLYDKVDDWLNPAWDQPQLVTEANR